MFDLPYVDENVGTCRDQIPVVFVINSRTSYGYRDRVNVRPARGGRTNLLDQEYANAEAL